jgi:hypothetical protein
MRLTALRIEPLFATFRTVRFFATFRTVRFFATFRTVRFFVAFFFVVLRLIGMSDPFGFGVQI